MYKYLGRRIYYLKCSGNIVLDTGERKGNIKESSVDEDFSTYNQLSRYNREKVGVIQLKYSEYNTEFSECTSFRVNPQTKQLEFDYSEIPPSPDVPQTPSLHEKVETQQKEIDNIKGAIDTLMMMSMPM